MEAELHGRLAVGPRIEGDLREAVRRLEALVAEAVAAPVEDLHDVACAPVGVAVARETAHVAVAAGVDVGRDGATVGRREGEEVDGARERLRAEEDVAAPLHDLDAAHALDGRRVVHVRFGVRVDRDRDAVLEHEDAATPAGVEAAHADVEPPAAAVLLTCLHAGDATEHLREVDRRGALDVLLRNERARAGDALERVGLVADHADLGRLTRDGCRLRGGRSRGLARERGVRCGRRLARRHGLLRLRERRRERRAEDHREGETRSHSALHTPLFVLHPGEGAGQSEVSVHFFVQTCPLLVNEKHTPPGSLQVPFGPHGER